MNELAVIDYCTGTIDIYKIESSIQQDDVIHKLEDLGYNMADCYYMISDDLQVRYMDEVL